MYKIVIWGGVVNKYKPLANIIKMYEQRGDFCVVGVVIEERYYSRIDGYKVIKREELCDLEFDYCVVINDFFTEVLNEGKNIGVHEDCLINSKVMTMLYFSFEKYVALKKKKISIISQNCWGGFAYNALGMRFFSPFINLFIDSTDFLTIMENFEYFMSIPLVYSGEGYNSNKGFNYPIGKLDDVDIHFLHYKNFEEAENKWETRKQRINYQDLVFVGSTGEYANAKRFDSLSYEKKLMFTTFKSDLHSCLYLPKELLIEYNTNLFGILICQASLGRLQGFDLFSFLDGNSKYMNTEYI